MKCSDIEQAKAFTSSLPITLQRRIRLFKTRVWDANTESWQQQVAVVMDKKRVSPRHNKNWRRKKLSKLFR